MQGSASFALICISGLLFHESRGLVHSFGPTRCEEKAELQSTNKGCVCRWCTMRVGALAATGANVLLLTFFILQSFQSPFGKRHLAQINRMMDMQRQALMAAEEHFKLGNPSAESYFKLWIKKDLSTWAQQGISEEQVGEMASRYKECFGEVFRFQIINGTLWVDHISERHNGWYPASSGPGGLSGKGKIPYAVLALMDVIRHHPGQIPDLDAVIQTSDFPCMSRQEQTSQIVAPPVFGYNSHHTFVDIPFPDYTYWGHEYSWLLGPEGYYLHGWEKQFKFLSTKWEKVSQADRIAQVMWRGRTIDTEFPERDAMRREFMDCPVRVAEKGSPELATLFNLKSPDISLHDTCNFRYPMYIESHAWVTNLKQKLACGSILVSNKMEYFEFFTRALKPGIHYVEVDSNNLCIDTAKKVQAMNDAFDRAGLLPSPADARMATTSQGRRHLRAGNHTTPAARSAVLEAGRVLEASRRTLRGGSQPSNFSHSPWNIGLASQQFMNDHVRMEDVRLYIRDVLKEYASLQTFKPRPSWNSVCYTGDLLLEQFGFPYEYDKKVVTAAYPWLRGFGSEQCKGQIPRSRRPQKIEEEEDSLDSKSR